MRIGFTSACTCVHVGVLGGIGARVSKYLSILIRIGLHVGYMIYKVYTDATEIAIGQIIIVNVTEKKTILICYKVHHFCDLCS